MMHRNRHWCVAEIATPEELAEKLTEMTWCGCSGFRVAGHEQYVFLNDATSADGAQEYAVVLLDGPNGKPVQIESITFSWCSFEAALKYIKRTVAGEYDQSDFVHEVAPVIESPEEHGRCYLCA